MPAIAAGIAWFVAVVVAAVIMHRFVAFAVVVQGESKRPSLEPGDMLLAGRARRRTRFRLRRLGMSTAAAMITTSGRDWLG